VPMRVELSAINNSGIPTAAQTGQNLFAADSFAESTSTSTRWASLG
jgi:hypothetical protein